MSSSRLRAILLVLLVVIFVRDNFSIPSLITPASGAREVIMVYEAKSRTPAQNSLEVALRKEDIEKYLAEKKHTLSILDNDLPSPQLERWKGELGAEMDGMLIINPPSTLLYKGQRPKSVSEFMDVLKKHGG